MISDIDNTLIGQKESLQELLAWLRRNKGNVAFGVATGRNLDSAIDVLMRSRVPMPHVLITSVGQ